MANINMELSGMYGHGIDSTDFLSRLGRLESQGNHVNLSVRNPKDVRWLMEQIAAEKRESETRSMVMRIAIGASVATVAVSFGLLGLLT